MDIFEKIAKGEPVDMTSPEYRPVIEELHRADDALYDVNHTRPRTPEHRAALQKLFQGHFPTSLGIFSPVQIDFPLRMKFGQNVFINHSFTAMSIAGIEIGDRTQIGPHVSIVTDNHDLRQRTILKCRPVVIDQNVWIGANALILPGVHVGDNSVIAGGAVVTKNVPANVVVAGTPARVIRQLTGKND